MSNLVERLRALSMVTALEAADEIERLTACIEHHQAVEADQERAIERLQSELEVWKANAETNLGEVERLKMERDALKEHYPAWQEKEINRMRAALERIARHAPEDTPFEACKYDVKIAREALRDE